LANAVIMPKAGITVESCIIGNWEKKVGDEVKVKVIKIDEKGKISLSIKKASEKKRFDKNDRTPKSKEPIRPADIDWGTKNDTAMSFDDMLSKFKQDSDEKMLALKRSNESKRSGGYKR